MSTGGTFVLITNDGKADKMIMATELLNQRIRDIKCSRTKQGYADPTPTLVDIEKTHILYVNAHFKPFAALGFEYGKVNSQSGSPQFGGQITFSIPQFGDFFNDMAFHLRAPPASCTASSMVAGALTTTVGANAVGDLAGSGARVRGTNTLLNQTVAAAPLQPFTNVTLSKAFANISETWLNGFPASTDGTRNPPDVSVEAEAMGFAQPFGAVSADTTGLAAPWTYALNWEYVYADGTPVSDDASFANWVAYADLPAARILKQVDFTVNNNPLDSYKRSLYAMNDQFAVPAHKKDAWRRALGHEVAQDAWTATTQLPQVANARTNIDGANVTRQLVQLVRGYQTPKPQQDQFEAWAPLLFWFNLDARVSIPSVSIPYGQRFITVQVADQAEVVYAVPGIYVQATHILKTWDVQTTGAADSVMEDAESVVQRHPLFITGSLPQDLQLSTFDLYINNIFVNPEIHDIYIHRIGFSLIRVHRFHEEMVSTESQDILLSQLKWPIEYMFIGFQPTSHRTTTYPSGNRPTSYQADSRRLWRRFNYALREQSLVMDRVSVPIPSAQDGAGLLTDATQHFYSTSSPSACATDSFNERRMVDRLQLSAHGNTLYNDFPSSFFNSYIPFMYGGVNISSSDDVGALLMTFGLYPGSYQPNGHINISRAREFYLKYTSAFIGSSVAQAALLVIARCINFILISDGSAVLRYST